MEGVLYNQIQRSSQKILHNTIPEYHLGHRFSDAFSIELRIKPPIDDNVIMIEVLPKYQILDAPSKAEYYKFETSTTFCFSGRHSKSTIVQYAYYVVGIAVDEFKEALKNTKSTPDIRRSL